MKVGDRVRYSGEGVITAVDNRLPGMAMVDGIWCDVTKMEIIPAWIEGALYLGDDGRLARWSGLRSEWVSRTSVRSVDNFTPVKRLIEEDL